MFTLVTVGRVNRTRFFAVAIFALIFGTFFENSQCLTFVKKEKYVSFLKIILSQYVYKNKVSVNASLIK